MHPSVHQNSVGIVDVGWADIDFGEVLGSTVVPRVLLWRPMMVLLWPMMILLWPMMILLWPLRHSQGLNTFLNEFGIICRFYP